MIVILLPALAVGGILAAAFTVTLTVSLPVAPTLSVTVNLNTYTPTTVSPLTPVEAALADPKVTAVGPLILVHAYDAIVPSASDPLPTSVVDDVGSVID